MSTLELHPLCTLFPRLGGPEFESLKNDISAHGLREPIVVHGGFILDGGNRYRACVEAGVQPTLKEFTGENAVSFVLSANLHRRHLTPGQQAAIVASAQDWAAAQSVGNPSFKSSTQSGNVAGLATVADRAAKSGASERTQRMADSVARQSPDLARRVAHGEISLPKAHEQLAPKPSTAVPQLAASSSGAPVVVPVDDDAPHFDTDETVPRPRAAPAVDAHVDSIEEQMTADELLAVEQAEVARLTEEVGQLRARIAVLEQGTDAAQLLALERDRDGYRNTSIDHFNKWAAANKKAIDYKALLDRLCKIAGVSKYSELAARVMPAARS